MVTVSAGGIRLSHWEVKLPLEIEKTGPLGRVYRFRRANSRCPAADFLKGCDQKMAKKLKGAFYAITLMGSEYVNSQRFKPLTGKGKPLWEFKEHDHRLYCIRLVRGDSVDVVLLCGWSKDKEGKSKEEPLHIEKALLLYQEYLDEMGG